MRLIAACRQVADENADPIKSPYVAHEHTRGEGLRQNSHTSKDSQKATIRVFFLRQRMHRRSKSAHSGCHPSLVAIERESHFLSYSIFPSLLTILRVGSRQYVVNHKQESTKEAGRKIRLTVWALVAGPVTYYCYLHETDK